MTLRYMRYLATGLVTILLLLPALSVELFRYRAAAKDGGTLEYVFEAGEQNSPDAVTKEKAAEIAADFMTTRAGVDWTPVWFSIEHKLNSHDPIGGGFSQFGSLLLRDKGRLLPNICVLQSDTTYSFSVDQS